MELGWTGMMFVVLMLSKCLVNPRVGQPEEVFHIFRTLKLHGGSAIVFDPTTLVFDDSRFLVCDWKECCPDAAEPVPPRAPEPLGKTMTMTCFVEAHHAGCHETRRSHAGIVMFLQKTPIVWHPERQNINFSLDGRKTDDLACGFVLSPFSGTCLWDFLDKFSPGSSSNAPAYHLQNLNTIPLSSSPSIGSQSSLVSIVNPCCVDFGTMGTKKVMNKSLIQPKTCHPKICTCRNMMIYAV